VIVPFSNYRIYTLGPEYSFSDLVARKLYPESEILYMKSNAELIEKALEGEIILVPCENTIAGLVEETINKIKGEDIYITKEVLFPVNQCLGGLKDSKEKDIEIVLSHQKALEQCKNYLNKNNLCPVETSSTSEAAKAVKDSGKLNYGVICSREAITEYGLTLLRENIQDYPDNCTIFWELSNREKEINEELPVGTAYMVNLKNDLGPFRKFFKHIYENDINVYFLNPWQENRKTAGEADSPPDLLSYWFLIKLKAERNKILGTKLERICDRVKCLGNYNIIDFR